MRSNQAVFKTQRGRPARGRLLCATVVAVAVAATAAADRATSHPPGLGVRVVGTIGVNRSHVGVIVAVRGAGGPLNAQAFRLWENGRPKAVRVDPLPASALRIGVVVNARPGDQLEGTQNAVADLVIGLPNGAEVAMVGARPARLVQPLTGDAGSMVRALAGARFSGPRDDASALTLAVREIVRGPPGRRAIVLITADPVPAALASAVSRQLRAANASLYVAAVPELAPSLARLASAGGGWAVTASSARSLMPAVDAIGADLAHQYRLAYTTAYPALTATRLRLTVAEAGTTATAEATVRVPTSYDQVLSTRASVCRCPPQQSRWCVCGLADRRGVADWPGRRGDLRSTTRAAPARPLVANLTSRANRLALARANCQVTNVA